MDPLGRLWVALVVVAILGIVAGIRIAVRRSQSASELSRFQHHLAAIGPPFPLAPDERVVYSVVARDLGAIRGFPDGSSTQDRYPACYPLVYLTTARLVVLMSTTDKPTAITGTYPAAQVNLHRRIGEQFSPDGGGFVSSASCRWETIGGIEAAGPTLGFTWTDREGVGAILVTVLDRPGEFVNRAIDCITAARVANAIAPAEPTAAANDSGLSYTFASPAVVCASCGHGIEPGDRFCTGCGAAVSRMANA